MTNQPLLAFVHSYLKEHFPAVTFYLCGSHYFGDADETSDVDVFTDYPFTTRELIYGGFTYLGNDGYANRRSNKLAIYEIYLTTPEQNRIKLNLFLVASVESRQRAQQYCIANKLTKEQRRSEEHMDIWDNI